jgi:predicted metalloenzyme YecM
LEQEVNFDDFHLKANAFLSELDRRMKDAGIVLAKHWSIDHICYRVSTTSTYMDLKLQFAKLGKLLIESEVNGRPISTFKLERPLYFLDRKVDLLELPAPKPEKPVLDGFEHIEVVCDLPFNEILEQFSGLDVDNGGLKKDFNAELEINLNGMSIKFHHLSLESVVTLERNHKVFQALINSEILNRCRRYSPLIAGSFPLGVETLDSDVDVLLCSDDLDEALDHLKNCFDSYPDFAIYQSTPVDSGSEFGMVRFLADEVIFEIYVESTETLRQRAYRHFQVEERLLKLGGSDFRGRIMEFRKNGLKTELAFGAALKLKGDPYLKLIEMHSWSEGQLLALLESVSK